jgi:NAD(P)-dependent dehydrogenase (short-subunit alcohol dehydrogenase family)
VISALIGPEFPELPGKAGRGMIELNGKVAAITGAAEGNGRGMAMNFAELGASVVLADVNEDGMREAAGRIGERALAVRCDVTRRGDIECMVEAAVARFGGIDIVVANAGVFESDTDCLRMTEEQWDRTIGVNLRGAFFTLQAGAKQMIRQGRGGRLIAIASIMAEWGGGATPAYSASKGGVRQVVKSFALACGRFGITANAIAPGFIETNMTRMITDNPPVAGQLIDRTPAGRIGQPGDVASVAAFLASDEASFVNGATIFCDGGITAGMYSAAAAAPAARRSGG